MTWPFPLLNQELHFTKPHHIKIIRQLGQVKLISNFTKFICSNFVHPKLGTKRYFPLGMGKINGKKTPIEKSLEFFAYYSVDLKT